MDLQELKQVFGQKLKKWIIFLVLMGLLVMASFFTLPLFFDSTLNEDLLEIAILVGFSSPLLFAFLFFISIALLSFARQRHKLEINEYVYSHLVSQQTESKYTYDVISVSKLLKKEFQGFTMERFSTIRFLLHLHHPHTKHDLYYLHVERGYGRYTRVLHHGLLYRYPRERGIEPYTLIERFQQKGFFGLLSPLEYQDSYLLFFDLMDPMPEFRQFQDAEMKHFVGYSKVVFHYFDLCSEVFD